MVTVGSFPSLAELVAWPTEHLTEAADYWHATGVRCYDMADQVWLDSMSVDWSGEAAGGLHARTLADKTTVSAVHDQLEAAAKLARGAASELYAARSSLRYAVEDARTAGFAVGEDLSVTDRFVGGSPALRSVRAARARALAVEIRGRAQQLVHLDQDVAERITNAVSGIGDVKFGAGGTHGKPSVQAVDHHAPIPERPKVEPEPPPGGWSSDPLKRAAQKIAYGHAGDEHSGDFPGMTKDQLAAVVEDMFRRNYDNPGSLVIGRTEDGAPVLYDPKTNVLVIRDPKALDAGTVYRPRVPNIPKYVAGKAPNRVDSIPPGELQDAPARPPSPAQPRPIEPPVRPAPPALRTPGAFGGGPVPPEAVPHPVHPPHSHHGPPVLGRDELPDLDEFNESP
ncbi:hypothetical protein [Mycobacterium kubicae]|uniref:hypothetical protein n=1 Tax=Mycobacterium kubicae TaxID=120959 RepID=UPI0007FBBAF8|nr:hypothetical protein [Mycobacterium kubicae]OBK43306.1 hypothetical protein A5657_05735 [Mycobacterium kubicae]